MNTATQIAQFSGVPSFGAKTGLEPYVTASNCHLHKCLRATLCGLKLVSNCNEWGWKLWSMGSTGAWSKVHKMLNFQEKPVLAPKLVLGPLVTASNGYIQWRWDLETGVILPLCWGVSKCSMWWK